MAVVPQTSAPTTWISINAACMIVVVPAPGAEDCRTMTAHNRPKPDLQDMGGGLTLQVTVAIAPSFR